MTNEEKKRYAREYRDAGFGRYNDKIYRQRHAEEIRAKDRERKRLLRAMKNKPRRDGGACESTC